MSTRSCALALALVLPTGCGGSTSGGPSCDGGTTCNAAGVGGASTGGTAAIGGTGGAPSGGAGGIGGAAPGTAAPPPPDPAAPLASGSSPTTLALYRLNLGDLGPQGYPEPGAWRSIGYDVDGIASTKNDANHCKPQQGATKNSVQTDGDGGIDNSFGANLLPIFQALAADPSGAVTQSIQSGEFTLLFYLSDLTPGLPSQNILTAALYDGAATAQPPAWNGMDAWPVTYESVKGGNPKAPKQVFPSSYLVNGTWVSSQTPEPYTVTLRLSMQGFPLVVPVSRVRFSMKLSGSGPTASGSSGIISGVIATDGFIAEFQKIAGALDPTLCEGATFESIAQQVRAASDIMTDGSNGNPTSYCNAISVGLAFDARAVMLGPVAPPQTPPPHPCAGS